MKQILLQFGIGLAVLLAIGSAIWVYGNGRYTDGKREVELKIQTGKYDRTFFYYDTLAMPKPRHQNFPVVASGVNTGQLDSLTRAIKDSSQLIQYLSQEVSSIIRDSINQVVKDSLRFYFRAKHELRFNPITRMASDVFTVTDLVIPVREIHRVVLRDPTFREQLDTAMYGFGLGMLLTVFVLVLIG